MLLNKALSFYAVFISLVSHGAVGPEVCNVFQCFMPRPAASTASQHNKAKMDASINIHQWGH